MTSRRRVKASEELPEAIVSAEKAMNEKIKKETNEKIEKAEELLKKVERFLNKKIERFLSKEELVEFCVQAIVALKEHDNELKKKSIYRIAEEMTDSVNREIDLFERRRIKEKMKAKKQQKEV